MTLTQRILERDGYRCAYCLGRATTMDHLIPKAERRRHGIADDDERYLVACCLTDNLRKGTRRLVPPSWKDRLDELPGTRPWKVWTGGKPQGAEVVLR